jgi:hypothetical protein
MTSTSIRWLVVISLCAVVVAIPLWWYLFAADDGLPKQPPLNTYAGSGGFISTPDGSFVLPPINRQPPVIHERARLESLIGSTFADAQALFGAAPDALSGTTTAAPLAIWYSVASADQQDPPGWPTAHLGLTLKPKGKNFAEASIVGVIAYGSQGSIIWSMPNLAPPPPPMPLLFDPTAR